MEDAYELKYNVYGRGAIVKLKYGRLQLIVFMHDGRRTQARQQNTETKINKY